MLVVELDDEKAKAETLTGGKGSSLAQILSLEVLSPQGFCITTNAYTEHFNRLWSDVIHNKHLSIHLGQPDLNHDDLAELRDWIITTNATSELRDAVQSALDKLRSHIQGRPLRVAVRSSSTMEDLQGASFAGQHDTFLNVQQEDTLIDTIKRCWASLWTERAYFYRQKRGFDHWKASMAVIVEEFIPSEEAGTLFMANPVTGDREEALVEASWGLGEFVVSGRVTPDSYYISLKNEKPVVSKKIVKNKRRMLLPSSSSEGGTYETTVPPDRTTRQVLSDRTILDLVKLGMALTKHYKHPLDIEWARYANHLYILQARPVTSLKSNP